ncbi:MAG: hypothetical protein ACRDVP_08875, partial [Acidimicrobiales bacterium]
MSKNKKRAKHGKGLSVGRYTAPKHHRVEPKPESNHSNLARLAAVGVSGGLGVAGVAAFGAAPSFAATCPSQTHGPNSASCSLNGTGLGLAVSAIHNTSI